MTKNSELPGVTYPKRMGVSLCRSGESGASVGPTGQHLRWFVPKSEGYPVDGFNVYKLSRSAWNKLVSPNKLLKCIDLTKKDKGIEESEPIGFDRWSDKEKIQSLDTVLSLVFPKKIILQKTNKGITFENQRRGAKHVLIRCREPIIFLLIEMELPKPNRAAKETVKVFYKSAQIASKELDHRVIIEQPNITDILLPLKFVHLKRICYVTENSLIQVNEKERGSLLRNMPIPSVVDEAYQLVAANMQEGLDNYFIKASTIDEFGKRYAPEHIQSLVNYLNQSLGHPDLMVDTQAQAGLSENQVSALDYLELAALDPNIARMLAVYTVDTDLSDNLYIVEGVYSTKRIVGFCFSRGALPLPVIKNPITLTQLAGISYYGEKPLGSLGMSWDRNIQSYMEGFNAPVFADIARQSSGASQWVTKNKPQLVNSRSDFCFREQGLPLKVQISYIVSGIDLFGRKGEALESNKITLKNLAKPVPPKNIKAKINQKGYPWTQPSQRHFPNSLRGTVAISTEYGEIQHRASPDAYQLNCYWRTGSRSAQVRDVTAWNLLETLKIEPPMISGVVFEVNKSFTQFRFTVRRVDIRDQTADNLKAQRLDPVLVEAADSNALQVEPRVELLLDQALLEPGLFTGYVFSVDNMVFQVIESTAGLSFQQDNDPEKKMTARLLLRGAKGDFPNLLNTVITVSSPSVDSISKMQIFQALSNNDSSQFNAISGLVRVSLNARLGEREAKSVGGELAIDFHYYNKALTSSGLVATMPLNYNTTHPDKKQSIFVSKLVAELKLVGNEIEFIVRLKPIEFLQLLLIQFGDENIETVARYYAPYILSEMKLGLNGQDGNIKVVLSDDQRFETISFSATAVDKSDIESSDVATPYELKIVNPPPNIAPTVPYPESGDSNTKKGFASIADVTGNAKVRIEWDTIVNAQGEASSVKYELARSLDKTIIATDLQHWIRGNNSVHHGALGITAGSEKQGALEESYTISSNQRTIQVTTPVVTEDMFVGLKETVKGRITIRHFVNGAVKRLHHKLLKVTYVDQKVQMLCQPHVEIANDMLGVIRANAAFTATALPDYSQVLNNDSALRQLADIKYNSGPMSGEGMNERAFGVVTGIPVSSLTFVDTVPGLGSNRYFYKVRAVFSNNLKSAWSNTSVGFFQLDLSVAEQPKWQRTLRIENDVIFFFTKPVRKGILGLRLLKLSQENQQITEWRSYLFAAGPAVDELTLKYSGIYVINRMIDLRRVLKGKRLLLGPGPGLRLTGIFNDTVDIDAPVETDNLLVAESVLRNNIIDLNNEAVRNTRSIAVRIEEAQGNPIWIIEQEDVVQITIDKSEIEKNGLLVQTIKLTEHNGSIIHLDSNPIELLSVNEEIINGD